MEWKEVKSDMGFWDPEVPGDIVEGVVVDIRQGQYGPQHVVQIVDGKLITTSSHKQLQALLASVPVGVRVRIVFQGIELPTIKGRNGMKTYKVYTQI